MSRWNPWWYELTKPFREFLFLALIVLAIPLLPFVAAVLWLRYGDDYEQWEQAFYRFMCRITSHQWADRGKWGVEPVCLRCEKEREHS